MKATRLIVSAVAGATMAGAITLSYAAGGFVTSNNAAVGDTGRGTVPQSANETPGPSTNTMTAPNGSAPNTTLPRDRSSGASTDADTIVVLVPADADYVVVPNASPNGYGNAVDPRVVQPGERYGIGDTGKGTVSPSANETPGPSTNTMSAPSGSVR